MTRLIVLAMLLNACGQSQEGGSPLPTGSAPPATTIAPAITTTGQATTGAVTSSAALITASGTSIALTTNFPSVTAPVSSAQFQTSSAPTFLTIVALTAGALTASPEATPTSVPTIAGRTAIPPTFTTGPTPQPQPVSATWAKDGVCYQVFVRSFFDSNGDGKGDLTGLISKLDYINDGQPGSTKSLGANCIWLMPVTQSPSYHGYDVTDYLKVNSDYGTNDDFKRLIQEAHKRGIYIITDLVLNHTSSQHPWFQQALSDPKSPYRDWYIFSQTDPGYLGLDNQRVWHKNPNGEGYYFAVFDASLPDLNLRNPAVTKQLYEVARFWLQDMGVDGFRLDAIRYLIEDGRFQVDTPETKAWLRDFKKFYTSVKPNSFTIGEDYNTFSLALAGYYPDQLDDYFEFSLAKSLLDSATLDNANFVKAAGDAYQNWPFQRFGTFLTNHDQNRVMSALGNNLEKMKMAAIAYMTLPGLPFVYYGEEIGMLGVKPDELIRTPMQWSGGPGAGFTTGQPWQAPNENVGQVNVQTQEADPASLLNLYRRLIKLRRATPALAQGTFVPLNAGQSAVAAYLRRTAGQEVLVLLNMSDQAVNGLKINLEASDLPPGQYAVAAILLNENGGSATPASLVVEAGGAIKNYEPLFTLPARSGLIVTLKKH